MQGNYFYLKDRVPLSEVSFSRCDLTTTTLSSGLGYGLQLIIVIFDGY
jgi:hypothetical protein